MEASYFSNSAINIILMLILLVKVLHDQKVFAKNLPFSLLVGAIAMANLTEALSWAFIGKLYLEYPLIGDMLNFLDFLCTAFSTYFSVQQIKVIAIDKYKDVMRSMLPNNIILAGTIILLLVNLGTDCVYYMDAQGMYARGPLYFLYIGACISQYVIAIIVGIIEAKNQQDQSLRHDLFKVAFLHAVVLICIFAKFSVLGSIVFWNIQGLLALINYLLIQEKYAEKGRLKQQEELMRLEMESAQREVAAKQDFLAKMSHDLRTPLNGIIGASNLLEDEDGLTGEGRQYVEKIQTTGGYMLRLINDILDLQQMETAQLHLKPVRYTRTELLSSIKSMIEPMCKNKGQHLSLNCEGEAMPVMVDKLRLEQICYNILSNGVKFTPEGGCIEYRQSSCKDGADYVVTTMEFKDNGRGMSAEFQKNMFKSFTREEKGVSRIEGSGLGLAIVKQLVTMMEGSLTCQSSPGEGTCITITLRLPIAGGNNLLDEIEKMKEIYTLKGYRILIGEDNEFNALVVRNTLSRAGLTVEVAEDGEKVLERFKASPLNYYDAVLLDIRMPGLGGLDTARILRSLPRRDASLPIIALSANAFDEDIAASAAAGMNAHLAKPVNKHQLYYTLGLYINKWHKENKDREN